jgi:predicted DNA-binding transcriptional regulator YafY
MSVSIMSDNVPFRRLKKSQRLLKLVKGMLSGRTFIQIAKDCRVSEKTIDRDFAEWKENGGFDKWLQTEFMRLHGQEVNKPESQAYHAVTELLKRRMKENVQLEANVRMMGFEADPDLKRALIEETDRQRREREQPEQPKPPS